MRVDAEKQTRLDTEQEQERPELKLKLYRLLLEKYADLINEKENRTVGEIKAFITKEDLTVQSIIEDFKNEDYSYDKDFLSVAKEVFDFVVKEISFVEPGLSVNFWLSPKEVFSSKVSDDEDLAIFLCCLLYGLDDEQAEVVIAELDNMKTHAFVLTKYGNKHYILDPSQKHSLEEFSGSMDDCLIKYSFQGTGLKRFLYKFNHSRYEQFL